MIILGIETTSKAASVALMSEERLIGEYTCDASLSHLQKLMPMIDNLLINCELAIDDIDVIAVSEGPGSFTGIRIGVSSARALAQTLDKSIIGVKTLKAMVYNAQYFDGIICPMMDARREQVFASAYSWNENKCIEIIEQGPYALKDLLEKLSDMNKDVLFLGDGGLSFKDQIIEKLGSRAKMPMQSNMMQKASSVCQLAMEEIAINGTKKYYEVSPEYLRISEAEKNLIAKKMGMKNE